MVLKTSTVLSCFLPARLGSPSRISDREKPPKDILLPLGDPDLDPFRGNPLPILEESDPRLDNLHIPRARANTVPSGLLVPSLLIPDGGIGETPHPAHRAPPPPSRQKRSSFTTFFAFSSKRRSANMQHSPVSAQSVSGRWVCDSGQPHTHLVNAASIPSALKSDSEEYFYSYCAPSVTPIHPASANLDTTHPSPSKQLSKDSNANPDLDSQLSSPVDAHPSHTHIRHPYAYSYSTRRHPEAIDIPPRLRHATSQPFQDSRTGANAGLAHSTIPSQLGREASKSQPHFLQPELKTSMSTPNLASGATPNRPRSFLRKKHSARSERWLSAETWWDALFSPSPRFKVKQAPRSPPPVRIAIVPVSKQGEPNHNVGVTFPSLPAVRPRAVSVTTPTPKPTPPSLLRSRSAVDLSGQPSTSATPHAGFEPALETLVDRPTPPPDQAPSSDSELPLPDPPLSLEQVLDEAEALEQQRAKWKQQASRSLGNKHVRSFSRARSKSLGERQARLGHHPSESGKTQLNFELLAARTLLGSQSMMPVVHITKPSNSSSHSKAYSHSHSQSAFSCTHSYSSRTHSHSHSLTASNSSKSSRNPPRAHSRNGSWSRTAFLKGALCGIGQDDSYAADEGVQSSSRDVQGTFVHAERASHPLTNDPNGEVGIAISSSPPHGSLDLHNSGTRHQEGDEESRWSSRHTHKSSEYAGPHPSVVDSNLPHLGGASDVSLRHRLPPRAAIHPPISPIPHPYRSATMQSEKVAKKEAQSTMPKVTEGQEATEPGRTPYLSLNHTDFARFGVGEALVYASGPRPGEVPQTKQADAQDKPSPPPELPSPQQQSPSSETDVLQSSERESPAVNSVPSLTNSTIQMVVSAFNDPGDLDEFQDLFYKPLPTSGGQRGELGVTINQVPTDVHSSTSSSPLTHLVRKLSEGVHSLRDPSRTPSDPITLQRNDPQDHLSNESGSKLVLVDLVRSSSPPPMESPSQLDVPIQEESEPASQPVTAVSEDVDSLYTSSVLEDSLGDRDNDTFGYPIKHGQLEVATTAPSPVQSPLRVSTHAYIQEDETDENDTVFLSTVTKRCRLTSVDAVRASYLSTSDLSRMSTLSDFPLPPGTRPVSILQAYFEATPTSPASESHNQSRSDDETEMDHGVRRADADGEGNADGGQTDDVAETLRALRMTPRMTSYESHRSTFGGSDDMDLITELHQAAS